MALRKRIWRIMKENKVRYIGIFVLVFLGSFYFIAATGISGNLEKTVDTFAEENKQEDLAFSADRPIEDITALQSKFGTVIEANRHQDVKFPGGELRLISLPSKINIPAVLSGRGIENSGDILLDPNFCRIHDLQIGGRIELGGKAFNIVGTMAAPNYIYIIKNLHDVLPTGGFGIGIISGTDMDAFPEAVTVCAVRFENRKNINEQAVQLNRLINEKGYSISEWRVASGNQRISMPQGNISSMKSMSFPVAVFIFLLGCFIVGVMVQRMVKSDGIIIGTLYAQGYYRRELVLHYITIPILLSAAGGLAGALLAIPCIEPVMGSMFASYILPSTDIGFSPLNMVIAVLMPVIIIGLSSFHVVRGILKKNTVELMKGGEQSSKVNFIERALRIDRFRFATKFQIREQVRSIPRLLFLVLGVSTASMILLYGLTFKYSMDVVTKASTDRYVYAIEYNFKKIQNIQDESLPEGAEPYNSMRCYPEGRESVEFYVVGMEPDSVGLKVSGIGGGHLSRDQVNITNSLATRLKLKAGNTIDFINKLNGQSYSLKIDGIVEDYGQQYMFMPLDEFNLMTGEPPGSYRTVLSNHEIDFDEGLLSGIMDARNPEAFEEINAPTTMIITAVTIVAVLVAVIIIFLVTSLIIDESRNTISLLKVFGYRKKELAKLILNSSTLAVLIGFILGVPFMLAFGNGIFLYVADVTNMLIPMIVNPLYVLISFILIFAVYEVTKILCGRELAKISMSEALKAGTE